MSTKIEYVVRVPIRGYHGMGYENFDHNDSAHNTEKLAREEIAMIQKILHTKENAMEMFALKWTLTDGNSFAIRGEPELIKRTTTEEVIT